ncbi:hypothetical protein [Flagellimonas sp.]|uniref:hypothetical protein n=1 Tax=Flagellimonas sp. TaxID=2058762 RepID=UPI003B526186
MRNLSILITLLLYFPLQGLGQKKIKLTKNPVVWTYQLEPRNPLPENVKTYSIEIQTDLDPMDFWDEANWLSQVRDKDYREKELLRQKAVKDTLRKWGSKYMGLNKHPFVESTQNSDLTIKLATDSFKLENLQMDVDYSDPESILGELDISAMLTVLDNNGKILLDSPIRYYIDDLDGKTTYLKVRHFMMNPSFKLKFKMTKKPEKKRKLLVKRVKKYEADILEYFVIEAGKTLKQNFIVQSKQIHAATFGIKNKGHEALNDASERAKSAINAVSAFSKKKRRSWSDVQPDLSSALHDWRDQLSRATNPEVQKALHSNIALVSLLSNDLTTCKLHLNKIPQYKDLESKGSLSGSYIYYLKGLDAALKFKEKHGKFANIQ